MGCRLAMGVSFGIGLCGASLVPSENNYSFLLQICAHEPDTKARPRQTVSVGEACRPGMWTLPHQAPFNGNKLSTVKQKKGDHKSPIPGRVLTHQWTKPPDNNCLCCSLCQRAHCRLQAERAPSNRMLRDIPPPPPREETNPYVAPCVNWHTFASGPSGGISRDLWSPSPA